jgi:hypothetical protein
MITGFIPILRRSNSNDVILHNMGVRRSNSCGNIRQENTISLSMGPVSMAVLLYVGERVLGRLVAGQLLRKGIARKIRRLVYMIVDWHVLQEVLYDYLEDVQ